MSNSADPHQTAHERPRKIRDFDKSNWSDRHRINSDVIPFEWGRLDQITALCKIAELIENTPKTAKTISVSQIGEKLDLENTTGISQKIEPLAEIHGAWRIDIGNTAEMTFINPAYIHIDKLDSRFTISDTEQRLEVLDRMATYGIVELKDIAPWFGIKPGSVKRFALRHDFGWQDRRSEGFQTMVRTWAMLLNWGYSLEELGAAFGYEPDSIRTTITRKLSEDFEPPADPTKGASQNNPDVNLVL